MRTHLAKSIPTLSPEELRPVVGGEEDPTLPPPPPPPFPDPTDPIGLRSSGKILKITPNGVFS